MENDYRFGELAKQVQLFGEQLRAKLTMINKQLSGSDFLNAYEEAKKNPDSVINHMAYRKKLDEFYWSWPYQISGEKIKSILENCYSESDFDRSMQKYFTHQKMKGLFRDVYEYLPRHHKIVFKQVVDSYEMRNYAIANIALMSIIDNILLKYMKNPASVKRKGIMEPMLNYYGMYTPREAPFWIRMDMLSHAINFIFEKHDFAYPIKTATHKKAHRHPTVHGLRYSNNRVDTILIVNTIYEISCNQIYMRPFEGTIEIYESPHRAQICKDKIGLVDKRIKRSKIINDE